MQTAHEIKERQLL